MHSESRNELANETEEPVNIAVVAYDVPPVASAPALSSSDELLRNHPRCSGLIQMPESPAWPQYAFSQADDLTQWTNNK